MTAAQGSVCVRKNTTLRWLLAFILTPGSCSLVTNWHIAGGGFFTHFSLLPSRLAWDAFGEKNGAASYEPMRERIEKYRRVSRSPHEEYTIGCILLQKPFFFDRSDWIPAPADFSRNIVRGKGYDLITGAGRALWDAVQQRLQAVWRARGVSDKPESVYGDTVLVRQRLGQGTFRILVTDVYDRHCAVTGEKVLPVLEAAHIRSVAAGGEHRVDNGLLLRSDIHTLFDRGYLTVTPEYRLRVSRRLKKDVDNGEQYYGLDRKELWIPRGVEERPSPRFSRVARRYRFSRLRR